MLEDISVVLEKIPDKIYEVEKETEGPARVCAVASLDLFSAFNLDALERRSYSTRLGLNRGARDIARELQEGGIKGILLVNEVVDNGSRRGKFPHISALVPADGRSVLRFDLAKGKRADLLRGP